MKTEASISLGSTGAFNSRPVQMESYQATASNIDSFSPQTRTGSITVAGTRIFSASQIHGDSAPSDQFIFTIFNSDVGNSIVSILPDQAWVQMTYNGLPFTGTPPLTIYAGQQVTITAFLTDTSSLPLGINTCLIPIVNHTSGIGDTTLEIDLTVIGTPISFTSDNHATWYVGNYSLFAVTAGGSPAPTFTISGSVPAWLSINPTSGVMVGTPASGSDAGSPYHFTITGFNGSTATQAFTLTVSSGTIPVITSANSHTFHTGVLGTFQFTATGTPTMGWSQTSTPPFANLNTATGLLSAGPASLDIAGSPYIMTIHATNGAGTASQTFTITVSA